MPGVRLFQLFHEKPGEGSVWKPCTGYHLRLASWKYRTLHLLEKNACLLLTALLQPEVSEEPACLLSCTMCM